MGKFSNFVIGAVVGAAIGTVVTYVFGPSYETEYDATYQSRLDKALAEGQLAAQAREAELMLEFEQAKRSAQNGQPVLPPQPAVDTSVDTATLPPTPAVSPGAPSTGESGTQP